MVPLTSQVADERAGLVIVVGGKIGVPPDTALVIYLLLALAASWSVRQRDFRVPIEPEPFAMRDGRWCCRLDSEQSALAAAKANGARRIVDLRWRASVAGAQATRDGIQGRPRLMYFLRVMTR